MEDETISSTYSNEEEEARKAEALRQKQIAELAKKKKRNKVILISLGSIALLVAMGYVINKNKKQ